ncbi:hypothetical protein AB205_0156890 [Aquarana catesbeiana]|uniref:Uncharacterized protein n=1 Tax=Aquarana catesbeiana TaxID=8400 RepID=A0A2G9SN07_AQUCT|nr:hypothetical protein AB205_0156890 [Aquarana catesbeiana]
MLLNMPVYHKKGNFFVLSNTKMLFQKYVGLFKNTFLNAYVNVHRVKMLKINNVWLLLSMLNCSFGTKLVFTVTMGAIY